MKWFFVLLYIDLKYPESKMHFICSESPLKKNLLGALITQLKILDVLNLNTNVIDSQLISFDWKLTKEKFDEHEKAIVRHYLNYLDIEPSEAVSMYDYITTHAKRAEELYKKIYK